MVYRNIEGNIKINPMPRVLLLSCSIAVLAFLTHAAFAPFYETGFGIYLSPLGFLSVAFCFLSLLLRKRWSWRIVTNWCWVLIVINLVFPPMPVNFGSLTMLARLLVSVEVVACALILLTLRLPKSKEWFHGNVQ